MRDAEEVIGAVMHHVNMKVKLTRMMPGQYLRLAL
jgi:hypothetical protein